MRQTSLYDSVWSRKSDGRRVRVWRVKQRGSRNWVQLEYEDDVRRRWWITQRGLERFYERVVIDWQLRHPK